MPLALFVSSLSSSIPFVSKHCFEHGLRLIKNKNINFIVIEYIISCSLFRLLDLTTHGDLKREYICVNIHMKSVDEV